MHKYQILLIPGNKVCADCNAADPSWASINLGITLCTQCVGIHRGLGTHISKTRSLSLDVRVWEPEVVKVMAELGNAISNKEAFTYDIYKLFRILHLLPLDTVTITQPIVTFATFWGILTLTIHSRNHT